jgi:hypothetical protein
METIYWSTEEELNDNSFVMDDYLENINLLNITLVDGTYAEGVNAQGKKFEIHASGNGDFFSHKIEFFEINK